ncbi:MAG: preprotein translocase subunit SecE [Desulfobacterales bacterium]|jgi:preprotein translocase subunit SecE|nr:preprotein translocase subunit SecE [Desulfobacterales bacterium]
MGRLLKKKTAFRPKKKENGAETVDASPVADESSAKGKVVLAVQKPVKTPLNFPGRNYTDKAMQFLREVRVELKKVAWPSRTQAIGSTVVVIVLVMILSFFLGAVDIGLSSLVRVVLQ